MIERRARVQGEAANAPRGDKPYGSVTWSEHEEAWAIYHALPGCGGQDAQRIHDRGGFGYWEMTNLLGHEPTTWEPRRT